MKTCRHCGSELQENWRTFCNTRCYHEDRRGRPAPMSDDGRRRLADSKRGDRSAMRRPDIALKQGTTLRSRGSVAGARHGNWKGGEWREANGRVHVRIAVNTYRKRARVVWDETHPDDLVGPGYLIHHINHDPSDDRPENLMKLTPTEHVAIHEFGGSRWRTR